MEEGWAGTEMPGGYLASHKVVIYSKNFSSSMFLFSSMPPFMIMVMLVPFLGPFSSFFVYGLCLYSVQRRR